MNGRQASDASAPERSLRTANGRPVSSPAELARIKALVIPPAWTDVWICPNPRGHIQATGRDARGRKQYRYHRAVARGARRGKYDRMLAFAQALPRIRRRTVDRPAQARPAARARCSPPSVRLLENTLIRVGNDEYARAQQLASA